MSKDPTNLTGKYILDGHTPVECPDLLKWAEWLEKNDPQVARTVIGKSVVSTIFLAMDRNYFGGPPILFETMAWDEPTVTDSPIFHERCCTWDEALAMHERAVKEVEARIR